MRNNLNNKTVDQNCEILNKLSCSLIIQPSLVSRRQNNEIVVSDHNIKYTQIIAFKERKKEVLEKKL